MTDLSRRVVTVWRMLIRVFFFSLCLSTISSSTTEHNNPKEDDHDHAAIIIQEMIEWVRSMGGFVHDKLELRRRDSTSSDISSPLGVFTTAPIAKHERLFQIPKESFISVTAPQPHDQQSEHPIYNHRTNNNAAATTDEIMTAYYANTCRLAHRIRDELHWYRNNNTDTTNTTSSEQHAPPPTSTNYRPFVAYLNTVPTGQLPATFTPSAKALLRQLLGPDHEISRNDTDDYNCGIMTHERYGTYALPPYQLVDWIDLHFRSNHYYSDGNGNGNAACISPNDPQEEHAVALAIQRGFDLELIPVWDMCNHHNGKVNTATTSLRRHDNTTTTNSTGVEVWADTDLAAGDELFGTYNYCPDCYDIGDEWGTPGIFRDFGFVEDYPQVWPFLENHKIYFEVGYFNDDDGSDAVMMEVVALTVKK